MGQPGGVADQEGHEPTRSPSFSSISDSSLLSTSANAPKRKTHRARCWVLSAFTMFLAVVVLLTISLGRAAYLEQKHATTTEKSDSNKVPDYFQTSPELFAGERPCSLISQGLSKLTACSRSHRHRTSSIFSPNKSRAFWSISIICP